MINELHCTASYNIDKYFTRFSYFAFTSLVERFVKLATKYEELVRYLPYCTEHRAITSLTMFERLFLYLITVFPIRWFSTKIMKCGQLTEAIEWCYKLPKRIEMPCNISFCQDLLLVVTKFFHFLVVNGFC